MRLSAIQTNVLFTLHALAKKQPAEKPVESALLMKVINQRRAVPAHGNNFRAGCAIATRTSSHTP